MFLLFLAYAVISSAMPASKSLLFGISSLAFVSVRMLISGGILLAWRIKKSDKLRLPILKQDALFLIALSVIFTFIPSLLRAYSLKYLYSAHACFFRTLGPFLTAGYAYLLLDERLTKNRFIGMLLSVCACVILMLPDKSALLHFGLFDLPSLAGIAAIALVKFRWIAIQDRIRNHGYESSDLNAISMTITGLCALVCTLIFEREGLAQFSSLLNIKDAGIFLYSIIFGSVLAYTFYGSCLKKYSATFMSLTQFLIPVFVSVYGWFFLGEPITFSFILATCVMLCGLVLFYADELKLVNGQKEEVA